MSNDQKPYEIVSRVFWIKIELKEYKHIDKQVLGEIRDVISGEKSPIWNLFDIIVFIIPYTRKMGIRINWFWRVMTWVRAKTTF
jgi:hypothetical protein